MPTLEIHERDWDKAASRLDVGPDFEFDRIDPDNICTNCAVAVAAERTFGVREAYVLDTLHVRGQEFEGPNLLPTINRFDSYLQNRRKRPRKWPIVIELSPAPSKQF